MDYASCLAQNEGVVGTHCFTRSEDFGMLVRRYYNDSKMLCHTLTRRAVCCACRRSIWPEHVDSLWCYHRKAPISLILSHPLINRRQ